MNTLDPIFHRTLCLRFLPLNSPCIQSNVSTKLNNDSFLTLKSSYEQVKAEDGERYRGPVVSFVCDLIGTQLNVYVQCYINTIQFFTISGALCVDMFLEGRLQARWIILLPKKGEDHLCVLEWDHRRWQEFIYEEHNDTYCDLPKTLFLNDTAFKSHSWAQNGLFWKLRV